MNELNIPQWVWIVEQLLQNIAESKEVITYFSLSINFNVSIDWLCSLCIVVADDIGYSGHKQLNFQCPKNRVTAKNMSSSKVSPESTTHGMMYLKY